MATKLDIEMMKASFVRAAQIAYLAGFDLIEIHAAHGYGLNQWLSPITNHRLDEYGGNHSNRNRLLYEIIKLIRKNIPSILISVRIPGQDYFSNGISLSDSVKTAQILELLGVDIISVSSGIGGWRRPRHIRGEGYLVEDAKIIQKFVSLPVIGVGGIKTRDFINQKLSENAFSLAAIGRGFLENPQLDIFTS
jgi:NADPH2 dehydrogenase